MSKVRLSYETYRYMISQIEDFRYKTSINPLSAYGNVSSVKYLNNAQVECVFETLEEAKEFEKVALWMELKR